MFPALLVRGPVLTRVETVKSRPGRGEAAESADMGPVSRPEAAVGGRSRFKLVGGRSWTQTPSVANANANANANLLMELLSTDASTVQHPVSVFIL